MFKYKNLTPYRLQINRHRNQHQNIVNIISKNDGIIWIEFRKPIFRHYFCPQKRDWDRQNRVNSWYTQYVRVIRHIRIAITRGRSTAEVKPWYFKTSFPNVGRQNLTISESEGTERVLRSRVKWKLSASSFEQIHWNSLKQIVGSNRIVKSWIDSRVERN